MTIYFPGGHFIEAQLGLYNNMYEINKIKKNIIICYFNFFYIWGHILKS